VNLQTAWIVAQKDLKSVRKKKSILYGIVFFPFLLALLFPAVMTYVPIGSSSDQIGALSSLFNAFSFFFVIAAGVIPTSIASYSIVGEKVEKSLEPLLATPTTDSEILLGKSIASFLPPTVAIYLSSVVYMGLMDYVTNLRFGFIDYPNWDIAIILFLVIPAAEILSIELSVIISARVNDVRSANQLSGLMFIPFMIIYLASEIQLITLNSETLLIIAVLLALVEIGLFKLSSATFRREEILTKWK
jgi:ABC-2 type transport system permease protein